MSKTILADVSGFTPIIDQLAEQYGLMRAAIFGRIWRFCQMEDGVCRASLDTIASSLGIDKATVMRHASELVKDGYLKDLTPDLRNRPHVYADTGKASIKIGIGAAVAQCNTDQKTVAPRNTSVAPRNTSVAQRNATVAESQLSKDTKKDQKKDTQETLEADDLSSRIDAHLHTLYNGQYARLNPVIRVDDVFGVITIGVETDSPQLAAQVRTYLKGLKARHKVKVVQTPAVTSSADLTAAQRARIPYRLAYEQARGGPVRWEYDAVEDLDWLISIGCPPAHLADEYRRNAADPYWQGKPVPFKVLVKNYIPPKKSPAATECYT